VGAWRGLMITIDAKDRHERTLQENQFIGCLLAR